MTTPLKVSCPITIQFYDVDPMNVVWHGHYPKFFEVARGVLCELLDYNYIQMKESGFAWPIVDMRIKYLRPLFLYQKILVEAELLEHINRLKIEYRVYDEATGELLTKASTIQVAVDIDSFEMRFESPNLFVDKVEAAMVIINKEPTQ